MIARPGARPSTIGLILTTTLALALPGGTAAQASTARTVQWRMYGYDLVHTGFNPAEHRLGASNVGNLTKAWTFLTGSAVSASPTVVDGVVYVGSSDNNLYALDAATGGELWAFPTGDIIVNSTAAVHDGVVYVGSEDDHLYAIDAVTGTERWSVLTGGDVASSPVVAGGAVYVGSGDGLLYKLDAATGDVIWTAPTRAAIFNSAAAIANGVVYVGSVDHRLYAFDSASGHKRWSAKTNGYLTYSPVVANGLVYESTTVPSPHSAADGALYAFDAATGERVWRLTVGNGHGESVANGVVYYSASYLGLLFARDAATGAEVWTKSMSTDQPTSKPTIANGLVYVGTNDAHVVAVDTANGVSKWISGSSRLAIDAEPTVVNGWVYFSSMGYNVDAYHLP